MATSTVGVVVAGTYLTNGSRLVQVLGSDDDGHTVAEDVVTEKIVRISGPLRRWRVVVPRAK